jgi:tRNA(fMet)-specific endonuclease VapC
MRKYMLDTNICVYVIRNYPANLRPRFDNLASHLCISAITLAELCYGAEKSARRDENLGEIEKFAARVDVLPFFA